ncbi:MAG: hypothetical protein E6I39_12660 [Chloroflexi bacterium]|nr:MAG: hypothetical protein E6I39_12660 [Chloroflexota bacterium]
MQRQQHRHVGPVRAQADRFQKRRVNELRNDDRVLVVRLEDAQPRPVGRRKDEVPLVEVEVEVAREKQDRQRRDRRTGGDDDSRVTDPHRPDLHAGAGTARFAG